MVIRAATGIDANAIADVQACVRRGLLLVVVRRGLLPGNDARAMAQWQHGGSYSVDGSARIEAADRAGRERLLRYCARPPFALNRLRKLDPEHLVYDPPKAGPGGSAPQCLTPLELLDRLAALVPPPCPHRHHHLVCWCERPLKGDFRGRREGLEVAASRRSRCNLVDSRSQWG